MNNMFQQIKIKIYSFTVYVCLCVFVRVCVSEREKGERATFENRESSSFVKHQLCRCRSAASNRAGEIFKGGRSERTKNRVRVKAEGIINDPQPHRNMSPEGGAGGH